MNVEDVDVVNAERDATPQAFDDYDPRHGFQRHYSALHPDQREALSRTVTNVSSDAESAHSSEASSVQLEEIRTQNASTVSRTNTWRSSRAFTERVNTLERHPTAVERIETHRMQHETTVGMAPDSRKASRVQSSPLPNFGAGKPYPPPLPAREEFVVEFDGFEDPLHPQNWPLKTKLFMTVLLSLDSIVSTFSSSVFSDEIPVLAEVYGVAEEVTTLGLSLFVLGYAFGPIIFAPMSELYGRRVPVMIGAFGLSVFLIGVATAENLQTVLLCRFFGGLFGSAPLAVVPAVFADIWNNEARGLAICSFAAMVFCGPFLGPFIGGFLTDSYLGWRWPSYIASFMGFACFTGVVFFLPESYAPVVLVGKAGELRRRTRNWGIHAKQEEVEVDLKDLLSKNLSRPMRILFTEPIVLAVTIYMSFVYGLLYLFLTAYSIVFQGVYEMNPGVGGLPYFGLLIGAICGLIVSILINPAYARKLKANNDIPVPEWRLPIVMAGSVSFTIGLFWFGWTGWTNSIPWIVPTLSGIFTGFGIYTIFLPLLNYIIDAYLMFAASAMAANTFLRSLCGAIFPLFATYMYDGMGIQWATTLIGCLAAAMIPMPFIFYKYGARIRARSKFAPGYDLEMTQTKTNDLESAPVSNVVTNTASNISPGRPVSDAHDYAQNANNYGAEDDAYNGLEEKSSGGKDSSLDPPAEKTE